MSEQSAQAGTAAGGADNWETLNEPVAWRPSEEYLSKSRLLRFMKRHGIEDYDTLMRRSIDEPEWFWDAVSDDLELVWQRPYTQVMDTSRGIEWTRWFVGGQLNYTVTALDKHAEGAGADQHGADLGGRGRRGPHADLRRAAGAEANRAAMRCARWASARATASASSCRWCRKTASRRSPAVEDRRDLHADLLRLRRSGGGRAPADCGAKLLITADGFYRRGKGRADEGNGR